MGKILGLSLTTLSLDECMNEALSAIRKERSPLTFACLNPHSAMVAQEDMHFKQALNSADQVVADGVGLYWMAKLAKISTGPRITGTDYFMTLMTKLNQDGSGRVFFFGASEETLVAIVRKFQKEFPKLTLCGLISPPFGEWPECDNDKMISEINAANPDVLWVGMTAPKQEKWVASNRKYLHAPVVGSIGAVFDFFAERTTRAPTWICNLGLEWLYRLCREPKRLWRRTLVSTPMFLVAVLRENILAKNN